MGEMFALACLLAAMAAAGREPDVGGFKAYQLPAYTIVTHDESNVLIVPGQVARIDDVLTRLLRRTVRAPSAPTFIALLPDALWRRYLEPGPAISGEFVAGRFANYIIIKNPADSTLVRDAVKHQYAHWFLYTQTGGVHPLWFDEGVAVVMQAADIRRLQAILGEAPRPATSDPVQADSLTTTGAPEAVNSPGWIPMKQLLRLEKTSPEYLQSTWSSNVHFESWALVHRALIFDLKFGQQMSAYLDALTAGQPVDSAVKSSFGVGMDDLDSALDLSVGISQVVRLTIPPARIVPLPSGRAMGEPESLGFIADIMLASGFHADRLAEIAEALQKSAPGSPAAFALRMRIAAMERDDATLERMSRESQTAKPEFARGAGLALFERVHAPAAGESITTVNREQFTTRAFELLQIAVESRPDDAEAVWASALLSAQLKRDLPLAMQRVEAVGAKLPLSAELNIAMARLQGASGSTDEMYKSLTEARQLSMSPAQRAELETLLASRTESR